MIQQTLRLPFRKLYAANVFSAGAITPSAPTATRPSVGVIDFSEMLPPQQQGQIAIPNLIELVFYGTRAAADNETLSARIERWRSLPSGLLVPCASLALSATLGTSVGAEGMDVLDTEYFADTLTASGDWTTAKDLSSPADNSIASVALDIRGSEFVTVLLSRGTCGSCNCLWSAC